MSSSSSSTQDLPFDAALLHEGLGETDLPNLFQPKPAMYFEVGEIPMLGTGKVDLKGLKDLAEAVVQLPRGETPPARALLDAVRGGTVLIRMGRAPAARTVGVPRRRRRAGREHEGGAAGIRPRPLPGHRHWPVTANAHSAEIVLANVISPDMVALASPVAPPRSASPEKTISNSPPISMEVYWPSSMS